MRQDEAKVIIGHLDAAERLLASQMGIVFPASADLSGWTPAERELGRVVQNRESKAQKILARLRIAPATSIELAKITHRFGARIHDLRRTHKISREDHVHDGQEWSVYTLEGE